MEVPLEAKTETAVVQLVEDVVLPLPEPEVEVALPEVEEVAIATPEEVIIEPRPSKEARIGQAMDFFPNVSPEWIRQQFDGNDADFDVAKLAEIVFEGHVKVPMKDKRKHITLVDENEQAVASMKSNPPDDSGTIEDNEAECPICCCESRVTLMAACVSEGHLFCRRCVASLAQEIVSGQATLNDGGLLNCMQPECTSHFSNETLGSVLDVALRRRLNEFYREKNVHAANLDNFERCRFCNWGACVEVSAEVDKVFHCQNDSCAREFCRLCGKDWEEEHFGKRCDELAKKDIQDMARREFEEKMAATVIRECPSCRTPFDKVEGCNMMTCRCGHTMCYICRQPNISNSHFCAHLKEPNERQCVNKCGGCMQWEKADVRDGRELDKLNRLAKKDERLAGTLDELPIGGK